MFQMLLQQKWMGILGKFELVSLFSIFHIGLMSVSSPFLMGSMVGGQGKAGDCI